jgi:hypothetical protein
MRIFRLFVWILAALALASGCAWQMLHYTVLPASRPFDVPFLTPIAAEESGSLVLTAHEPLSISIDSNEMAWQPPGGSENATGYSITVGYTAGSVITLQYPDSENAVQAVSTSQFTYRDLGERVLLGSILAIGSLYFFILISVEILHMNDETKWVRKNEIHDRITGRGLLWYTLWAVVGWLFVWGSAAGATVMSSRTVDIPVVPMENPIVLSPESLIAIHKPVSGSVYAQGDFTLHPIGSSGTIDATENPLVPGQYQSPLALGVGTVINTNALDISLVLSSTIPGTTVTTYAQPQKDMLGLTGFLLLAGYFLGLIVSKDLLFA